MHIEQPPSSDAKIAEMKERIAQLKGEQQKLEIESWSRTMKVMGYHRQPQSDRDLYGLPKDDEEVSRLDKEAKEFSEKAWDKIWERRELEDQLFDLTNGAEGSKIG